MSSLGSRPWAPLVAASLCACASPGGVHDAGRALTVEAEGWAAADGPRDATVRRRAVLDALRRALEQATGVSVRAATRVDEGVAVKQRIEAQAQGSIESYEVVSEARETGGERVRVRAVVARPGPGGAPRPSPPPPDAPAVAVRVSAARAADAPWLAEAESGLRAALASRGYAVRPAAGSQAEGVEVRGVLDARPVADPRLGEFRSCRARLRLEVVESADGRVVAAESRESAGLGLDEQQASLQAVDRAAALAGGAAADALTAYLWKRP